MMAKNEKKPEIMYESLVNTKKAQELQPKDKSITYNIALVEQQYAQLISDQPVEIRTSEMMRKAIQDLDHSQELFKMLINVPESEHVYYDRKMAEQRERYGETLRTQMDRKMLEQVQYEEQRESKLKDVRLKQEEREAKRRQEELDRIKKEEEERLLLEENRRKLMEKVREDNMLMAQKELEMQDDEEETKKSRSKKRKNKNDDDGIINDEEEEEEERYDYPKDDILDDDPEGDAEFSRRKNKVRIKYINIINKYNLRLINMYIYIG